METVIYILVGALAFRGAMKLVYLATQGQLMHLPVMFTTKTGYRVLQGYMYIALPIAMFNGYVLNGWTGMLVVGVGTWIGALVFNIILTFNPIAELYIFGLINVVLTLNNFRSL